MTKTTKKINFYVTETKYMLLKKLASEEERTLSNVINFLIPPSLIRDKLKKEEKIIMYNLDCPHCKKKIEIEGEVLPDKASDSVLYECNYCNKEIKIGWTAEIEVRNGI